jgi:glycosyltransferase involved in cell wall biosynthesis
MMKTADCENPDLSVVIPVYDSEAIFPELHRRLTAALEGAVGTYEILAVVDGCRDNSYRVIADIARRDRRVKALSLSRNFGHQSAVRAGLQHARGKVVAVMDDDLEDPPEVLPKLLARMKDGFDVVYGVRKGRHRSWAHRLIYKTSYRVLKTLVDIDLPNDAGDFAVMSRRIVDVLNALPEQTRYLRGLRAWSGFPQTGLEYDREPRFAGRSGYTARKYIAFAKDATFSFSYKPLQYIRLAGLLVAVLSAVYAATLMLRTLTGTIPNGSGGGFVLAAVMFFSGVQLMSIGIIGEYISRIYDEVKGRPRFLVRDRVGFGEDGASEHEESP